MTAIEDLTKEQREQEANDHLYGAFFTRTRSFDNYITMFHFSQNLPLLIKSLSIDFLCDTRMFWALMECYGKDIKLPETPKTVVYWGQ